MNAVLLIAVFVVAQTPIIDDDWTPRPATKGAEPWLRKTDRDWIDKRFQKMDTGPFLNCGLAYPYGIQSVRVGRATAIKVGDKGDATMVFDRNLMRWAVGWTDGFLELSDRRYGLLNVALPPGQLSFSTPAIPGWSGEGDKTPISTTRPLPPEHAKYRGLYLDGKRVALSYLVQGVQILESPWRQRIGEFDVLVRNIDVSPSETPKSLAFVIQKITAPASIEKNSLLPGVVCLPKANDDVIRFVAVVGDEALRLEIDDSTGLLRGVVQTAKEVKSLKVLQVSGPRSSLADFFRQAKGIGVESLQRFVTPRPDILAPGPRQWQTMSVKGKLASDDTQLVVDTLTVPHDNPHRALMFLSGVDFFSASDLAVTTAHGDVWMVNGVDAGLDKLTWRRFATGLYQPLGIKIINGQMHVLERGQLTRLHDHDLNGEADYYENVCSDWHVGEGPHSFDTCLEADPKSSDLYFFKTGDTETPTGGCLMKISGNRASVFATGFRHPIGLCMSPDGILTGADQEGNWMPSTRIDLYRPGGFYGDMRAHHRPTPPKIYDPPICWVPHHVDNSAGGQAWLPQTGRGDLSGRCLHFSYGRCNAYLLSMETIDGVPQGGVIDLKIAFTSGVMSGRVNPFDGHLYVAGLRGWQNAAQEDGCLQRVRYTGRPLVSPLNVNVRKDGLAVSFSQPLDRAAVENVKNYRLAEWNYRWTGDYGSKRYSVKNLNQVGQDDLTVTNARLLDDKTVLLSVDSLHPVMQMQIGYNLRTQAGQPLVGSIYNTINVVPK